MIKQLVTLKLGHLSKIFLIFLMTFSVRANGTPVDTLAFKIENKIYFVSDLNLLRQKLRSLNCLGKSSALLKAAGFKDTKLKRLKKNPEWLAQNKELLENYLLLYKLNFFVGESTLKANQLASNLSARSCVKSLGNTWAKKLLGTEYFLRKRFDLRKKSGRDSLELFTKAVKQKFSSELYF